MHLHIYLITLAEDEGEATSNVSCFIDDHFEKEFYDYGGLEEPEKVVLLDEVRENLAKEKEEWINEMIPKIENDMILYKEKGFRDQEGYAHKRYGDILCESFCPDMPFFNIDNWDWSLPMEIPEEAKNQKWFAVMVDLHF